ncbi:response regulator [Azospirillum sp. RWY-5-1]|uniref:Response regulator n=1 Tax=Azospirillum oleiclasticum TaxID=2735135 RepID=A0ABX2T8Z5_9PROT|nr:response regulator [Azospirillum oleiclasticum]NYZ12000.1 response regulator [Azospirillum oleiclasticum]NYZ19160.1 response regulator [Azospirillum oleiclasticum]
MTDSAPLQGRSILLVEDEAVVAMMVEDMLAEAGASVVGPAYSLDQALDLARSAEPVHAALLDVNVGGQAVFPVAEALAARGIPFAFASGYGEGGIVDAFRNRPSLQKPFHEADLLTVLSGLFDH